MKDQESSPLIEYVNFKDGTFVNLVGHGTSYAVYETTTSRNLRKRGLFETYEQAKEKFELITKNGSHRRDKTDKWPASRIIKKGLTEYGKTMLLPDKEGLQILSQLLQKKMDT